MKRTRAGFMFRRVAPALIVFGAVHVYADKVWRWPIAEHVMRWGEAAGCQVIREGGVVMGMDGPFFGGGPKTRVWNRVYRHAPWASAAGLAYIAAMVAYSVCAGPLGRTRLFGYRGQTRCGVCGYTLHGLKEPRCPECGRAI